MTWLLYLQSSPISSRNSERELVLEEHAVGHMEEVVLP